MSTDWNAIEAEAQQALSGLPLRLDVERVAGFARDIASGALGPHLNLYPRDPEPVGPEDVDLLERLAPGERERLAALGREALARGEVATAVLNGGMATRFGGVVKGVVEALAGRAFLDIKLLQARRARALPFLVMNSFATHRATLEHLSGLPADEGAIETFLQGVSLRLTPEGEPFREDDGSLSLYAPGHGDFPDALRAGGLLERLERRGVAMVLLSNVDNLGAEPDPQVIGYHLDGGRPLTCEIAAVAAGDAGGTPARVDGRIEVVEAFRFSPDFDFSRLHFLSTNSFVFSLELLARRYPLRWFWTEKRVCGRVAIQMERLVNQLSSFVPTGFLATPRDGPHGRFFPVKTPDDLLALRAQPALVERFGGV